MPRLLAVLLLIVLSHTAGADEMRLQVGATILSRCDLSTARLQARDGAVMASIARCNGTGETLTYRVSGDGAASTTAALRRNTAATIATTRHGQVPTIEF